MRLSAAVALLRKEWRTLAPLILALALIEVLSLLPWFLDQAPDEADWSSLAFMNSPGTGAAIGFGYFLLGVIATYMVFPHERDQRTLPLLWSLPVSRWWLYVGKLFAALAAIVTVTVIGHVLALWLVAEGASGMGREQFRWDHWWLELLALGGISALGVAYGALIAQLRILGVLLLALMWGFSIYVTLVRPDLQWANVANVMAAEYRGQEILLNPTGWYVHGAIAVVFAVLGGALWTRDTLDATVIARRATVRRRIANVALVIVVTFAVLLYAAGSLSPQLRSMANESRDTTLENIVTRHYDFTFFLPDSAFAQLLAQSADDYARSVYDVLQVDGRRRIVADLTDDSADHLGIAGWNRLRMNRDVLTGDPDERLHVLVHETAHVAAMMASDRRLGEHGAYAQFFSEGLAEWVAYEILGFGEQRSALRDLAALAWDAFDLDFPALADSAGFRARFDENLVYAIGDAWVSSLADVCGNDAPARVLAALARPDAPQRLGSVAFWRDTLQAIDCDLNRVNAHLDQSLEARRADVLHVPAVASGATREAGRILIGVKLDDARSDTEYRVIVRVRDSASVSRAGLRAESVRLVAGESAVVEFSDEAIAGERYQYQVGIEFAPGERPFYGPWLDAGT